MKYKKYMIMLMLVILIFGVTSVCASNVDDASITSEEDSSIELSHTNVDENLLVSQNDELISDGNVGTFSELQSNITATSEGSTLTLTKNYECEDGFDSKGIIINQSISIDGKGYKIDAK